MYLIAVSLNDTYLNFSFKYSRVKQSNFEGVGF